MKRTKYTRWCRPLGFGTPQPNSRDKSICRQHTPVFSAAEVMVHVPLSTGIDRADLVEIGDCHIVVNVVSSLGERSVWVRPVLLPRLVRLGKSDCRRSVVVAGRRCPRTFAWPDTGAVRQVAAGGSLVARRVRCRSMFRRTDAAGQRRVSNGRSPPADVGIQRCRTVFSDIGHDRSNLFIATPVLSY